MSFKIQSITFDNISFLSMEDFSEQLIETVQIVPLDKFQRYKEIQSLSEDYKYEDLVTGEIIISSKKFDDSEINGTDIGKYLIFVV